MTPQDKAIMNVSFFSVAFSSIIPVAQMTLLHLANVMIIFSPSTFPTLKFEVYVLLSLLYHLRISPFLLDVDSANRDQVQAIF